MGSGASSPTHSTVSSKHTAQASSYDAGHAPHNRHLGKSTSSGPGGLNNLVSSKSDGSALSMKSNGPGPLPITGRETGRETGRNSAQTSAQSNKLHPVKGGFSTKQAELRSISAMDSFRRKRLHTNNDSDDDEMDNNLETAAGLVIDAHCKFLLTTAISEALHLDRSLPTYNLLIDTLLRFAIIP
jgi:hypothetical protein